MDTGIRLNVGNSIGDRWDLGKIFLGDGIGTITCFCVSECLSWKKIKQMRHTGEIDLGQWTDHSLEEFTKLQSLVDDLDTIGIDIQIDRGI